MERVKSTKGGKYLLTIFLMNNDLIERDTLWRISDIKPGPGEKFVLLLALPRTPAMACTYVFPFSEKEISGSNICIAPRGRIAHGLVVADHFQAIRSASTQKH